MYQNLGSQSSGHQNSGFLLIDKPNGPTSAAIVGFVKRVLRESGVIDKDTKIGHGGTLDPMATGLVVVLFGKATRLSDYALHADKVYSGEIQLGVVTNTDDVTGEVIGGDIGSLTKVTSDVIEKIKTKFTGTISQRPPAFSALKIKGERAYDLARAGKEVELANRDVTISELELSVSADDKLAFRVRSSGGTYIRSLARDIGEFLGCGGSLASLRRDSVSALSVDDSVPIVFTDSQMVLNSPLIPIEWWKLLPKASFFNVDEAVSSALAGGDQRVLKGLQSNIGDDKNAVAIYTVNGLPHGVVRLTNRGLELVVHVGANA